MSLLNIIIIKSDEANYWSTGQFSGQFDSHYTTACGNYCGHNYWSCGKFDFYYIIYSEIIKRMV